MDEEHTEPWFIRARRAGWGACRGGYRTFFPNPRTLIVLALFLSTVFVMINVMVFSERHAHEVCEKRDIIFETIGYFPSLVELSNSLGHIVVAFTIANLFFCFNTDRGTILRRGVLILTGCYMMRTLTLAVTIQPPLRGPVEELDGHFTEVFRVLVFGKLLKTDEMFSGHTCAFLICLFHLYKYHPRHILGSRLAYLLVFAFTAVVSVFGMLILVVAQLHYTSDVVVAAFLVTLLYYYYHLLIQDVKCPRWLLWLDGHVSHNQLPI